MPGGAAEAPVSKRVKRLTLVIFLLILVGAPIVIILTGILPREGAGYPFYWLHDHIYLPVKGYTYTLLYPFSLSWWGPLGTIVLVWLVAYLARVPLTRDPHSHILRRIVRRPSKHRILLNSTRLMRKWGFGVLLLQEVVNQERQKAMNRLIEQPQTGEEDISRVFHLTNLHIKLLLTGKAKLENYEEAAPVWYHAFLQTRSRGATPTGKNNSTDGIIELTTQLAQLAPTVLLPLLNIEDDGLIKKIAERTADFDLESIVLDLYYLAALHNETLALKLPGITTEEIEHPSKLRQVIASRLAESVSSRQAQVDRSRRMLERFRALEIGMDALMQDTVQDYLPLLRDNSLQLPLLGRMVLWIVLDYAALMETSAPALSFMESLEGLDFEFNCIPGGAWDPARESDPDQLSHPLKQLPQPSDFRWCAHMAQKELGHYETAWKELETDENNPVSRHDIQLARARVRSLFHAAGPKGN